MSDNQSFKEARNPDNYFNYSDIWREFNSAKLTLLTPTNSCPLLLSISVVRSWKKRTSLLSVPNPHQQGAFQKNKTDWYGRGRWLYYPWIYNINGGETGKTQICILHFKRANVDKFQGKINQIQWLEALKGETCLGKLENSTKWYSKSIIINNFYEKETGLQCNQSGYTWSSQRCRTPKKRKKERSE